MPSQAIPPAGTYRSAYPFTDEEGVNFLYGAYDPATADNLSTTELATATVD